MTDAGRGRLAGRELVTARTRRVGGLHLVGAGLCDAATGIAVLALWASGRLLPSLIETLPAYVDEVALVANASLLRTLATTVAPLLGAALVVVGLFQVHSGRHAYHARRWRRSVGAAALGLVNPVALPPSVVAVVLLSLSRAQFRAASDSR